MDILETKRIRQALDRDAGNAFNIAVIDATGSTNSDLIAASSTLPSGTVLAANHQTAGRGRRGRNWVAPPGGSLAFSVLWNFETMPGGLSGLSLAAGMAVARAVEQCGVSSVRLKWPNDLVAPRADGWAKAGGILVEVTGPAAGPCYVVIGIGLNVALGAAIAEIDQAAIDLSMLGLRVSHNQLLATILNELLPILRQFAMGGFLPFRDEWNRRHAYASQAVTLLGEGRLPIQGTATGADGDGALLLETPDGIVRIISGDVSLRRASLSQS